ncbi:anti-sigma factor family protein [Kribbella kalugense]|uniref:Putative zinc finger protein n=1 Tax=Kribbella kalugense TaxID=2512221 RepID=A0A4R7ZDV1_9ACTN|nr:zf-HC2 domain-containing protein [Kribbella kalugense]TDW14391.1 putative zinc finger protein [Kribbella kalugense]
MSEHDRTQLGAYALGALEPGEAEAVDEHLATCEECRAELAELNEMKDFLGEVPPEAFLEGPPEGGDLLLQRTLREVRELEAEPPVPVAAKRRSRSRWLLVAAALVVVAGALGGGIAIGRSTAPEASNAPTAGSKQVTTTDTASGATMATTVEPRTGWSWVQVHVSGLKAGDQCVLLVTDKTGKSWTAGSWVVSEKAAKNGSTFAGGVLIPLDQVGTVEIRTVQGQQVVKTAI